MRTKETPHEYARRRANETGRAYIVSSEGHVMLDCANNRRALADLGVTVEFRAARHPSEHRKGA